MEQLLRQIKMLEKRIGILERVERTGAWADWTPTVTQGVSVAISVDYARYTTIGRTVIGQARFRAAGNGTAGSNIFVGGIPANVQPTNTGDSEDIIGSILIRDPGVAHYHGALVAPSGGSWAGFSDGNKNFIGNQPNFGLASGDEISLFFVFER